MPGGYVKRATLPTGPNGRPQCRWCNLEVSAGRFSFCSEWCVHEWKLRSDPGYLREQVLARDHARCALCGIDCESEIRTLKRLSGSRRVEAWARWGLRPGQRRSLWDADHVVPVAEGGGECDLENMRTLCLICHRRITSALRARLRRPPAPEFFP
jgi:5-methylcytosine-specific restriction protein A